MHRISVMMTMMIFIRACRCRHHGDVTGNRCAACMRLAHYPACVTVNLAQLAFSTLLLGSII